VVKSVVKSVSLLMEECFKNIKCFQKMAECKFPTSMQEGLGSKGRLGVRFMLVGGNSSH